MKLVSFHSTLTDAKRFSAKLKKQGAKGVTIGKKQKEGYPVYSVIGQTQYEGYFKIPSN